MHTNGPESLVQMEREEGDKSEGKKLFFPFPGQTHFHAMGTLTDSISSWLWTSRLSTVNPWIHHLHFMTLRKTREKTFSRQ